MTTASLVAAVRGGAGTPVRPAPGRWGRLAAMHARAFAREPSTAAMLPAPFVAVAVLWLVTFGMLAAGLGFTDSPGRRALALVLPSRWHRSEVARAAVVVLAGALGVFGVVLAIGLGPISGPVGFGLLAVLCVLAVPAGVSCVRGRAARARLRRARPTAPHWLVSGVCRAPGAPGAGAELMRSLCDAADREAVALALEAIAPELVTYYARFGFAPTGAAETLPGGAVVTPMARAPRGIPDA